MQIKLNVIINQTVYLTMIKKYNEPKTCFSNVDGEPECAKHNHCEYLQNIKIGQIFNQCYDKVKG